MGLGGAFRFGKVFLFIILVLVLCHSKEPKKKSNRRRNEKAKIEVEVVPPTFFLGDLASEASHLKDTHGQLWSQMFTEAVVRGYIDVGLLNITGIDAIGTIKKLSALWKDVHSMYLTSEIQRALFRRSNDTRANVNLHISDSKSTSSPTHFDGSMKFFLAENPHEAFSNHHHQMFEALKPAKDGSRIATKAMNTANTTSLLCAAFLVPDERHMSILIRNIESTQNSCHWAAVLIGCKEIDHAIPPNLVPRLQRWNSTVSLFCYSGPVEKSGYVPKPLMYPLLLSVSKSYQYIWLLDGDISLEKFQFGTYFRYLLQSFPPGQVPLISQPIVKENSQNFQFLNEIFWRRNIHKSNVCFVYPYVEQQMPLFDATFFRWYVTYVVKYVNPLSRLLETDWGHDMLWCKAAETFHNNYLNYDGRNIDSSSPRRVQQESYHGCTVVFGATPINHLHSRSIGPKHAKDLNERWMFCARGYLMLQLLGSIMPSWTYNLSNIVTLDYIYKENLLRGSRERDIRLPAAVKRPPTPIIQKRNKSISEKIRSKSKLSSSSSTAISSSSETSIVTKNEIAKKEQKKKRPRIND